MLGLTMFWSAGPAMDDTFYLTNMSPQVGAGFNRNYWSRLEQFVRQLTTVYADVYVLTGPLWLPKRERDGKHYVQCVFRPPARHHIPRVLAHVPPCPCPPSSYEVIGDPPNVAVPTHFFKVILVENPGGANRAVAGTRPECLAHSSACAHPRLIPSFLVCTSVCAGKRADRGRAAVGELLGAAGDGRAQRGPRPLPAPGPEPRPDPLRTDQLPAARNRLLQKGWQERQSCGMNVDSAQRARTRVPHLCALLCIHHVQV